MKKLAHLFLLLGLIITSCQNDDDAFIALCETPSDINAINITFNSVELNWNHTVTNATFVVEIGLNGFTQGTGNSINASTTSLHINDLLANTTYQAYLKANCGAANQSMWSDAFSFTTLPEPVVAEFKPNLSELNLFSGALSDLNPSIYAFEYQLSTPLFTDYAHKQRLIALPQGTNMTFDGDGLPIFPNNTVIAKTFYYYNDERNHAAGKHIIETRILLKRNGVWELGDYKWNAEATEAILDDNGSEVPVSWIDNDGTTNNINYKIPSNADCFTCHNRYDIVTPIGPKLRTMNFDVEGQNQLVKFINSGYLNGLDNAQNVAVLPNWEDPNVSLENRVRAYFEVNCAHCHIPGGFCDTQSNLDLDFSTPFENSSIFESRFNIRARMGNYIPGFSMPFIGTVSIHDEGKNLVFEYLDTL